MQQDVAAFIAAHDAFINLLGIRITEAVPGRATAVLDLEAKHLNSFGTVHGGVLFSLAECAFGVAANAHGKLSVAVNCSITFTKPGLQGQLSAVARETSKGPRISSYAVEISNDAGEIISTYQGLAYHRKECFPPQRG